MAARRAMALAVLLVLAGCTAPGADPDGPDLPAPAPTLANASTVVEATVTRVIDGVSLDAHIGGRRTAVGYLGAETPLRTQPCGEEALARNRELAGTRVFLEDDPAYQFDASGRRLSYAYTSAGASIDETLVREGLARAVRTDARYGAYLAALQAEAEAAGRGCLWNRSGEP